MEPALAVDQRGRYGAGTGHVAFRQRSGEPCDEDTTTVTVETSGEDGVWEDAAEVEVGFSAPTALDVVLVADNSGSEAEYDDLIAAAVSEYGADLLAGEGNRAGLVRVSTEASVLAPLSDSAESWASGVGGLGVKNGWTALWDGVRLGHEVHEEAAQVRGSGTLDACVGEAHRVVVVYTDGQENNSADEHETSYDGDGVDTSWTDLLALDVVGIQPPIFTIGVGDGVSAVELESLATSTGGDYLPIDSVDLLADSLAATSEAVAGEVAVCWETADCSDTYVRVTVTTGEETWTETFTLPTDLCVDEGEDNCTLTQGYWKNHPEAWPVSSLELGDRTYSQADLITLMETATRGDRSLQLADQLIAAKLSVLRGADDSDVDDVIADADVWLVDHDDGDGLPFGTRGWDGADTLADTLDAFNNGEIGPGHCD